MSPDYATDRVAFLADNPRRWTETRLKNALYQVVAGGTPTSSDAPFWTDDESVGTPWVAISDMTASSVVTSTARFLTHAGVAAARLQLLPAGTLLYSIYASLGKVASLGCAAVTNQAILGLIPRQDVVNQRFLRWWLLHAEPRVELLSSSNTQANLNAEKVGNLPLLLPPSEFQRSIANYLDEKTAAIDALIEKKRKLLDLLAEERAALINQAVTKGLDPSVPMKDSGIPWIGEIPAHWHVAELRRKWLVIDCKHRTPEYVTDGYKVVSTTEIKPGRVNLENVTRFIDEADYLDMTGGGRKPEPGDIIYSRNASLGAAAFVDTLEPFSMGQDVVLIKSKDQNQLFLAQQLNSGVGVAQVDLACVGSTFKRINVAQIRMLRVCIPPLDEQNAIAEYVDEEEHRIGSLASRIVQQIERLQEYRQALITAAVTGQLDIESAA